MIPAGDARHGIHMRAQSNPGVCRAAPKAGIMNTRAAVKPNRLLPYLTPPANTGQANTEVTNDTTASQ